MGIKEEIDNNKKFEFEKVKFNFLKRGNKSKSVQEKATTGELGRAQDNLDRQKGGKDGFKH